MSSGPDVMVVGGGLAGWSLARALVEQAQARVEVIEDGGAEDPAAGSDVPCALVHPFAGRSFQPRPEVFHAWRRGWAWFSELGDEAAVHAAPLRRVFGPGEGGERLRASWSTWRATIVEELGGEFVLEASAGEVRYGPAFAFEPPRAVAALRRRALGQGATVVAGHVARVESDDDGWCCRLVGGARARAPHVVIAAGAGTAALLGRHGPTLTRYAGTLWWAPSAAVAEFVIDGGHRASSQHVVAVGSVYHPEGVVPGGAPPLPPALAALWSGPPPQAWTGIRVVDPHSRLPWIETRAPGLHVFSAFGSQGGLWIPAAAEHFAARWRADGRVARWPAPIPA